MRRALVSLILVICVALGGMAFGAGSAVSATIEKFYESLEKNEMAALAATLTPEAFTGMVRSAYFPTHWGYRYAFRQLAITVVKEEGGCAIAKAAYLQEASLRGKTAKSRGTDIFSLKLSGDRWVIDYIVDHRSDAAAPLADAPSKGQGAAAPKAPPARSGGQGAASGASAQAPPGKTAAEKTPPSGGGKAPGPVLQAVAFNSLEIESARVEILCGASEDSVAVSGAESVKPVIRQGCLFVNDVIYRGLPLAQVRITVRSLERLKVIGTSAVQVRGIDGAEVRLVVTGSSAVKLSGRTGRFVLEATGASITDAETLVAGRCEANLSGGCTAIVCVTGALEATALGRSTLEYYGNPKSVKPFVEGGGSLIKR